MKIICKCNYRIAKFNPLVKENSFLPVNAKVLVICLKK